MPEFAWRAAEASGNVVEGRLTAPSAALAMKQLRGRGLTPLRVDDAAGGGGASLAVPAGAAPAGGGRQPKADPTQEMFLIAQMVRTETGLDLPETDATGTGLAGTNATGMTSTGTGVNP